MFDYVTSVVVNNFLHESQYCNLLPQNEKIKQSSQKFWEIENACDSNLLLSHEE